MCAAGVVYGLSFLLPPIRTLSFSTYPPIPSSPLLTPISTGNYKSAIDVYEGGPNIRTVPGFSNHSTAGIFCTYPAAFMTRTGQFFSEFIASTILMFLIYVLQDNGNLGAGNLTPLMLFFVIFGIGACFGWETGYAINLARDFGKVFSFPFKLLGQYWR
jgi:glycerol uptake facilitator-like aquaporin